LRAARSLERGKEKWDGRGQRERGTDKEKGAFVGGGIVRRKRGKSTRYFSII